VKRADLAAWPLRALIAVYRYGISPFMAGSCRFHPSCSNYADEALATHGVLKGGFLGFKRICRCHPWGGADTIRYLRYKRTSRRTIYKEARNSHDRQ